jgi:hypothetical protein
MLAHPPNLPRELGSSQVLVRFCLRMLVLVAFATFGGIGFGRSLAMLLWMSIIFSAVMGAIRRESPFGGVLNYWDETVAYATVYALIGAVSHTIPV